jgi:hypothetical protein
MHSFQQITGGWFSCLKHKYLIWRFSCIQNVLIVTEQDIIVDLHIASGSYFMSRGSEKRGLVSYKHIHTVLSLVATVSISISTNINPCSKSRERRI